MSMFRVSTRGAAATVDRSPFFHRVGCPEAIAFVAWWAILLTGCTPPDTEAPTVPRTASVVDRPPATTANPADSVATNGQAANPVPASDAFRPLLDDLLQSTLQNRQLNTDDHGAWQILHGVLAYQRQFPVRVGREGPFEPALQFAMAGGKVQGWTFVPGEVVDSSTGRRGLRAIVEAGTRKGQGHADQWLAIMAQSHVPLDQPLQVGEQTFHLQDLVDQVKRDVPHNLLNEWSWSLIGLSAYLAQDATWQANDGHTWSLQTLLERELEQDINSSACGGTHRLVGLATAVKRHVAAGGTLDGPWHTAHDVVQTAIEQTLEYQNQDGSFSAQYLRRPSSTSDIGTLLGTTGHLLEFLTVATTDEQLRRPQVRRAAEYLRQLLADSADLPLECGALYHAVHGLVLYRSRIYGPLELQFDPKQAPTSPSEIIAP